MHRVKLFFFALRSLLTSHDQPRPQGFSLKKWEKPWGRGCSHDIPPSGKIFSQARRYPLFALLLREVDLFLLISYKSYLEK